MVVLPRAARPMRQGTADRGNRTILKPDFQTGHPQPRIDHLRAGFSPDSVCLVRRKSPSPHPVPETVSDRESRFLFFILAWGRRSKTLEGEPWFVAADVCRALELERTNRALSRLDDDEKGTHSVSTPGGRQMMSIVSESGLYALVLSSRKPEAKALKRWITHEVIPSIRKTGGYIAGQETIIPTSSLRVKAMPLIQPRAMKLNSHLLMQWPPA